MSRLTPKQAAEHACVSIQLIYTWCGEKRLPHTRVGARGRRGRILIDVADLDSLMESLKVAASWTGEEDRQETPRPSADPRVR